MVNVSTGIAISALDIPDYIYRSPSDDEVLSSLVTDAAKVGIYTVTYTAGMAAESDYELATRT